MARNRTPKQRRESKRLGVYYLPHQRNIPVRLRIHHELVALGENELQERAELQPIVDGFLHSTMTARVMRLLEDCHVRIGRTLKECGLEPVEPIAANVMAV